jgi:hypothetical protein
LGGALMFGINFSPTIDLGHIVEAFVIAIGGLGVIYTLRNDVKTLKDDMSSVKTELEKITDVLVELGRQDERINAIDKRIDDLKSGN